MGFEPFLGGRVVTKEPRITIIKQGIFNFNKATIKILKERKTTHIQLLYDKTTRRIAFKPCSAKTPGATVLRDQKGVGQVSGVSFLKTYDIPYADKTRSYPAKWDEAEKMFIIKLI